MKEIIKAVTRGLSSKVAFYFGPRSEANLVSENEENSIIALMTMYDKDGAELQPGQVENTYRIDVLFLKRSELDLDFDSRYDDYLNPMEGLADEFYIKLKDYMEKDAGVRSANQIKSYRMFIDNFNLFDVNYDGALIRIVIPKRLNISYCKNNYTLDISSNGATVNGSLTWLHTISEISADNLTFGATANLSKNGYTFTISAGSELTGSYSFSPVVGKNFEFQSRFYVKWSDGVITPMNIKVNYVYAP